MSLDDDIFEDEDDFLLHYGTLTKSGRYPWGSGEHPFQRLDRLNGSNFYIAAKQVEQELKAKNGKTPTDAEMGQVMTRIYGAEKFGLKDGDVLKSGAYRAKFSLGRNEQLANSISTAEKLRATGMSHSAIAKEMGLPNESSVRKLLEPGRMEKAQKQFATANILKEQLEKDRYIDIGSGIEAHMGVSPESLKASVNLLKEEGYKIYTPSIQQLGTGHFTKMRVLGRPDTEYRDLMQHTDEIGIITSKSDDLGRTYTKIEPPKNLDSKRLQVVYAEDGGTKKDGVIELRPGVEDISLGDARYAQVRIAVDGSHYLKGMAMYANDLPDGVDVRFNTNKKRGTPVMGPKDNSVLKPMKNDPENPFGATIKLDDELIRAQRHYIDKDGKRQQSTLNIVREEGDWAEWRKSISSQVLSKQSNKLAKEQLDKAYKDKHDEYEEIMSLTNPTLKKKLLETFSDNCDSAASELRGAAFPRQGSYVILPFNNMKENEIYAPNYKNGEKVVLIRYPHGGKFEIPELVVNNNSTIAKKTIGNDARDAVGINSKVAERLSGADFDGDTVLVIPNNSGRIKTAPALEGLKNFDPKIAYPRVKGMKVMTKSLTQQEMGKISNLITDMTIKGADFNELARAVRHSMVVIDAEKHGLNYMQSYKDNRIAELKEKYQGGKNAGASTIISRASSDAYVNQRSSRYTIDPETGKKTYFETGETYLKPKTKTVTDPDTGEKIKIKTGEYEEVARQDKTTKMAIVDDAYKLTSGGSKENLQYAMEGIYADHANKLKSLANEARKTMITTEERPYSPSARKVYKEEYDSLREKIRQSKLNSPFERKAQAMANKNYKARLDENPDWDNDDKKKARDQELKKARLRYGIDKKRIVITDKEWEAIQAGAITKSMQQELFSRADLDMIKERAMPKAKVGMSASQTSRAKSMIARGLTLAQVAEALGVSVSTIQRAVA